MGSADFTEKLPCLRETRTRRDREERTRKRERKKKEGRKKSKNEMQRKKIKRGQFRIQLASERETSGKEAKRRVPCI